MKPILFGILIGVLLTIGTQKAFLFHFLHPRELSKGNANPKQQITQQIAKNIKANLKFRVDTLMAVAEEVEKGNHQQFDKQIFDLGMELNRSIEESLHLSVSAKSEMDSLLMINYPEIASEARKNYLDKVRSINAPDYYQFSSTIYRTRAEILASALNSTTCSFANLIFIPLNLHFSLSTNIAAAYFMQSPCEIVLSGVMEPIGNELYFLGLVKDLDVTQGRLKLQKESALAEFATSQMDIKVFSPKIITRSIDVGKWNLTKWEAASLKINYDVTVKYGYDLSNNFTIERNDKQRILTINIPDCQLVDIKLDPIITDANAGIFSEIDNSHYRLLYTNAQKEAIKMVEKRGIKDHAQNAMKTLISYIFSPFTSNNRYPYQLKIVFNK